MKYTVEEYLNSGFYDGDMESDIENVKQKIVKCRKPHKCHGGCNGTIDVGDHALVETGFMDGTPVSCFTCLPCIDKWLDELKELEQEG